MVLAGVFEAMSPVVLEGETDPAGEPAMINFGVLGGIVTGLIAAVLWQRFYRTKLPDFLGFFGGRRCVPIITAVVMIVVGVLMSFLYPLFNSVLTSLGEAVNANTVIGGGIFGVANRLLIPLGLHHIINSVVWFILGDYNGVQGDLNRFFAGDPDGGRVHDGLLPDHDVRAAGSRAWPSGTRPARRSARSSAASCCRPALTAFLTGITEPLEFSFLFVALAALHHPRGAHRHVAWH